MSRANGRIRPALLLIALPLSVTFGVAIAGAPSAETDKVESSQHWAYAPPVRPPLPVSDDPNASNPIDAFLGRERERLGLRPVEEAEPRVLVRRAYFDLVGLPPTLDQQNAFVVDDSPGGWDVLVEKLLASPHYGERWGRHWMDVWRYSDWDGYKDEVRGSQKNIWRWRDWIVRSLNEDVGYDQMILAMLAGDELAPNDFDVLPATGFLARNFHPSNRDMWLDATVEHTAKAFLGMTMNCARCHDHKYDPIAQTAYFQFRAIFEPHHVRLDLPPGETDPEAGRIPRAYDANLSAETFFYAGGDEKQADKENPLAPAAPSIFGDALEITPIDLPIEAFYPALAPQNVELERATANAKLAVAEKALEAARGANAPESEAPSGDNASEDSPLLELRKTAAQLAIQSYEARLAAEQAKFGVGEHVGDAQRKSLAVTAAAAERRLAAHEAVMDVRAKEKALSAAQNSDAADAAKKQSAINAAKAQLDEAWKELTAAQSALATLDDAYSPVGEQYPRTSSGRRLALARWIAKRQNPLTARVAVNHIWLRHFGTPLVENVFDFGLQSSRPRHADLLDWLAVELMDNDWSMKHIHRLILSSRAWRMASTTDSASRQNVSIDPDNRSFWRMNSRRLEAEIVRDAVLAVTEELDPTLGGPDIDFQLGESSRRRSIYLRHAYEKQATMLLQFDAASPNECYRRSESVVPQQALALSNSSLTLGLARMLARKIRTDDVANDADAKRAFVQESFVRTLARPPVEEESEACVAFLEEQARVLAATDDLELFQGGATPDVSPSDDPAERARENLVHVLLNHNDFVTVR